MNNVTPVEILLVEDNPNDAELAMHALQKHRLANRVHHVSDGVEALDYLFESDHANVLKVVFLDLKLPKLNGLEVLERLRANEKTKHLPVVVMTSSKEEQDIVRSYQLGVNSYVVKPVDFDVFRDAVADLGFYWAVLNQPPVQ